jgi:hypothetical protein
MMGRTNLGQRLLVLAAVVVLIAGSTYDFYSFSTQSTPRTTSTQEASSATSTHSTSTRGTSQALYNITFYEAAHPPGCYVYTWSVEMAGMNKTISGYGSSPENVTFSVPNGVYPFTLYPSQWMGVSPPYGPVNASGPPWSVTVASTDIIITVTGGMVGAGA